MTKVQEKTRTAQSGFMSAPLTRDAAGGGAHQFGQPQTPPANHAAPAGAGEQSPPVAPVVRPPLRRINLLPPEVAKERKQQQMRVYVAAGLVALVIVLGGVYLMKVGEVASARSDLAIDRASNARMQSQISSPALQSVVKKSQDLGSSEKALAGQIANEVSVPRVIDQLMLNIPDKVWYTSVTLTGSAGTAGSAGSATPAKSAAATPNSGATSGPQAVHPSGKLQFVVKGECGQLSTAALIDALKSIESIADAWPTNSTKQPGTTENDCQTNVVVDSTVTAQLSEKSGTTRAWKLVHGELP